jgi:hypothetical protein
MDIEVLFHGLVIIGNFDLVGVLAVPAEADAILVIDSDAVPARPAAFERFQVISWRDTQFAERGRGFELSELSKCDFVEGGRELRRAVAEPKRFGRLVGERLDHKLTLLICT